MKNHYLSFLTILLILPSITSEAQTLVQFGKTINLLEHIQPAVVPTYGKRIRGFKVVSTLDRLRQSISTGPLNRIVGGSQPDDPPCPHLNLAPMSFATNIVSKIDWIGPVIGDDISEDGHCICEIHPAYIYFQPIYIHYTDGTIVHMPLSRLPGHILLCPNTNAGHLLSGGRDIAGDLNMTLSFTLRIADDGMSLLADIFYQITPYTD